MSSGDACVAAGGAGAGGWLAARGGGLGGFFGASATGAGGVRAAATGGASGASGGGGGTIVVPVYLDGREIARVTTPYVRDEINKNAKRNAGARV